MSEPAAFVRSADVGDSLAAQRPVKRQKKDSKPQKKRKTLLKGPAKKRAKPDETTEEMVEMMARNPNYSRFKARTLVPGTIVLCKVVGMRPGGLRLALPNGLFGYVPKSEIDAGCHGQRASDVYSHDSWVLAAVAEHSPSLLLTLRPSAVNSGCEVHLGVPGLALAATVTSESDKGFALDLGIAGFRSFLRRDIDAKLVDGGLVDLSDFWERLVPGSPLVVFVKETLDKHVAVTVDPSAGFDIDRRVSDVKLVRPGSLVQCVTRTITAISATGDATTTSILPAERAFEDLSLVCCKVVRVKGLNGHWAHPTETAKGKLPAVKTGVTRWGRVVGLVPHTHGAHAVVSFLPHVVGLSSLSFEFDGMPVSVGAKFDKITIGQVDKGLGTYGVVRSGDSLLATFTTSKKCQERREDWWKSFSPGATMSGRVTSWNSVDGRATVDLGEKKATVSHAADLEIGSTHRIVVESCEDKFLLVRVDKSDVRGRVSMLDIADAPLKKIDSMHYHEGKKFKARVRAVNFDNGRVDFTMKPTELAQEEIISDVCQLSPGQVVTGVVTDLNPSRMMLRLFGRVMMLVNSHHLAHAEAAGRTFKVGELVTVKVLDVKQDERRVFATPNLDFESSSRLSPAVAQQLAGDKLDVFSSLGRLAVGTRVAAEKIEVVRIFNGEFNSPVALIVADVDGRPVAGFLGVRHLSDDPVDVSRVDNPKSLVDLAASLGVSVEDVMCVDRRVKISEMTGLNTEETLPLFSAKPSVIAAVGDVSATDDLLDGAVVKAWVRLPAKSGLVAAVGRPRVRLMMLSTEWGFDNLEAFAAVFPTDSTLEARVAVKADGTRVLKPLRKTNTRETKPDAKAFKVDKTLPFSEQCASVFQHTGSIVTRARVRVKYPDSLKLQLLDFHKIFVRVHVTEVFDEWENGVEPLESVEIGDDVQVKILGPCLKSHPDPLVFLDASMRLSCLQGGSTDSIAARPSDVSALHKDQILPGGIVTSKDYKKGVFVSLSRTLTGRIPLFHVRGEFISFEDAAAACPFGSVIGPLRVRDVADGRAVLSLVVDKKQLRQEETVGVLESDEEEVEDDENMLDVDTTTVDAVLGSDEEEESSDNEDLEPEEADPEVAIEDAETRESDAETPKKAKKNKKPTLKERAEALTYLPDHDKLETVEDYERMLVTKRDASAAWIKYMAYFVELNQLDQARAVAERAINSINYREERERFNMWVAFMNLEATFGTPKSLDAIAARAEKFADVRQVLVQLSRIHEARGAWEECRRACRRAVSKFGTETDVWRRYLETFFKEAAHLDGTARTQVLEEARKMFVQSLRQLPKSEHISITMKFAKLEYDHGSKERAKTLFETLVGSRPKRTDLWLVFLDAHVKAWSPPAVTDSEFRREGAKNIRDLFNRATNLDLKPAKMVPLYKRWRDFETKWSLDPAMVQRKAEAYVRDWESRST